MTNNEIREAINEIIRIKALKCREQELRQKIFKELRKRRKDKLGLGGEDFVKITPIETKEYSPWDLFKLMCSTSFVTAKGITMPDAVLSKDVKAFCELVNIVKGEVKSQLGQNFFDSMTPNGVRSHDQLSYSVSLDEKNRVRGIDL